MRLFAVTLWISLRHSSRRLLCLFCVLLAGGVLAGLVLQSRPEQEKPVAVIAVVDLDENPMAASALRMLGNSRELKPMFRLEFVDAAQAESGSYAAVLTIPAGFTQSVLTGENLSPEVKLNPGSPLEAMWARQMAKAGAGYLSSAQLGVYGALELAEAGHSQEEYNALVTKVNLMFARAFLDRLSRLEEQRMSVTGALTLPQYYLCAAAAALLLCYGFLYTPAVLRARRFRLALRGRGGVALWLASFAHILLLELVTVAALCGAAVAVFEAKWPRGAVGALVVLAVLAGSFAMLVSSLSQSEAVCAVAAMLLSLGSALASGGFVPLTMMPPVFERVAPQLPTGQGSGLFAALFGAEVSLAPPLVMSAVFLVCSALLWLLDGTWERRRGR